MTHPFFFTDIWTFVQILIHAPIVYIVSLWILRLRCVSEMLWDRAGHFSTGGTREANQLCTSLSVIFISVLSLTHTHILSLFLSFFLFLNSVTLPYFFHPTPHPFLLSSSFFPPFFSVIYSLSLPLFSVSFSLSLF